MLQKCAVRLVWTTHAVTVSGSSDKTSDTPHPTAPCKTNSTKGYLANDKPRTVRNHGKWEGAVWEECSIADERVNDLTFILYLLGTVVFDPIKWH